ncbi:transmembrane epididymal protein 1A [Microcaecilia unicolor]|uniref:Transmembrane epididymal protein 1A-like n=1 Tax=Microcaecilia unicolor TaxID=1415580 RepID=A0A6P7Z5Q3_9AMPH|nr:transmembrane epididymal protein 1A-like [Microcaecilia unicolor]
MGTFIGHISPGLAFLSFGIFFAFRFSWMVLNGERIQYAERRKPKMQLGFRSFLCTLPVDGVLKVIYGTLAVMAEFFYPPGVNKFYFYLREDADFQFRNPNEWQHVTMYGYFAFSGWVDIVSQTCLPRRLVLLEHVGITVAFYITTLLLKFHMHGKEEVENRVHTLLLLTCFLTSLILTAEIWKPNYRQLWFSKTCLVMIQGTWLLHAAFILYRPPTGKRWDSTNMANLMFLTNFYCWHVAVNALLLAAIFGLTTLLYRLHLRSKRHGDLLKGKYLLGWNGVKERYDELQKLTRNGEEEEEEEEAQEKRLQEEVL